MPDLLLELFSEEIPARMQAKAAEDLRKLVTDRLVDAGLVYEGAKAFATPRRLALWVQGLPARQPDVREERRGPRVGAPEQAIAGFLKAAGLMSIDQAKVQPEKKGDFYIAVIEKPGRPAIEVIAEIVPEVVRNFPWPKSMRWGAPTLSGLVTEDGDQIVTESGDRIVVENWIRWVRPLHSIVATFGPETEEPDIVLFEVGGIQSGDTTRGHRFMAPAPLKVKRLDDYTAKLEAAKVVLDPARRQEIILADAQNLAFAQGYELVEDAGLLAEVAGLVEWPVVLMGSFDEAFLSIPPEVIRTTIRNNQKCFVLNLPLVGRVATPALSRGQRGGEGGRLAPRFILVANIEASDGGAAIVAGNERVIRARLSDAKFFYGTDLKIPLQARLDKLKEIVFHEKLGTQYERVERIERLARELAPIVGADPEKAARAARLAKADLVTEMVGEFPELQGLMGKYYALAQGEEESVARACEEHYKPLGQGDSVPIDSVSIAVALADKIDTLVGFWAIDEKPTGSKDPYALRRAALGVIRLIAERSVRIHLGRILIRGLIAYVSASATFPSFYKKVSPRWDNPIPEIFMEAVQSTARTQAWWHLSGADEVIKHAPPVDSDAYGDFQFDVMVCFDILSSIYDSENTGVSPLIVYDQSDSFGGDSAYHRLEQQSRELVADILVFFADRLKVQLRERGARHDLVDAVFALGGAGYDDLVLIVRRVEALGKFLDTDDGKNLLAGYKRATNIIRIEEKKDVRHYHGKPDPHLYLQKEERELAVSIAAARHEAEEAVAREDFEHAMHAIATLRPFVDAFFDKVTVNVEMSDRRENRLKLLNEIREATRAVADFSKIEG